MSHYFMLCWQRTLISFDLQQLQLQQLLLKQQQSQQQPDPEYAEIMLAYKIKTFS